MVSSVTNLGANAARRYIEINSTKAGKATEELSSGLVASNPSYDPSSAAVGYRLTSNIESLLQAGRNVSQAASMIQMATGFLGATNDVLTRMKRLTVAANTDTVGDSERKMLDAEFQTLLDQVNKNAINARWGGVSLFTGGGGTATPRAGVVAAETISGGNGVAGTYFGTAAASFSAANSQGLIDGTATAATVTMNGSLYELTVTVGNQTFKGTTNGAAASTVLLTSTTDSGNVLSFVTTGVFAGVAAVQSDLRSMLGIGTGTPAVFASVNTAAGMPTVGFTAGGATNAGTWALTYTVNGTTGTFKATRGAESYTTTVTATNPITGSVSFNNGINLTLTAFNGSASVAGQFLYDVSQGTAVTQTFQYAEKSTDILSVSFRGANTSALGLTGANILTTTSAAAVSTLIDLAQQNLNEQIGDLGGKASQFKFMTDTLRINVQNSQAAKATFTDADVAMSMQDLQTYNGLQQISQSVFGKALNDLSNLVQLVQSVR